MKHCNDSEYKHKTSQMSHCIVSHGRVPRRSKFFAKCSNLRAELSVAYLCSAGKCETSGSFELSQSARDVSIQPWVTCPVRLIHYGCFAVNLPVSVTAPVTHHEQVIAHLKDFTYLRPVVYHFGFKSRWHQLFFCIL